MFITKLKCLQFSSQKWEKQNNGDVTISSSVILFLETELKISFRWLCCLATKVIRKRSNTVISILTTDSVIESVEKNWDNILVIQQNIIPISINFHWIRHMDQWNHFPSEKGYFWNIIFLQNKP